MSDFKVDDMGGYEIGSNMSRHQVQYLQKVLSVMFPDLKPGEILFELDVPISTHPDWDVVLQNAIQYAQNHNQRFLQYLNSLKLPDCNYVRDRYPSIEEIK